MPTYTHHHLTAEHFTNDNGPAIMLTQQEDFSDPDTIVMHPWQLRAVCEQFGLIASDPQSEKTVATLQRRLLALKERIDHLGEYLATHSDHRHADLSYETNYATATADICDAYCADFMQVEPDSAAAAPCEKTNASSVTAALPGQLDLVEA